MFSITWSSVNAGRGWFLISPRLCCKWQNTHNGNRHASLSREHFIPQPCWSVEERVDKCVWPSDRGMLVHVPVSICMCPSACDKERIASQKVWGRGFHQQCSHQHQYASNLKQPSADVTGDLYGIRPATLVTDQPGKKHGRTSLMGGHQHRPTAALIA